MNTTSAHNLATVSKWLQQHPGSLGLAVLSVGIHPLAGTFRLQTIALGEPEGSAIIINVWQSPELVKQTVELAFSTGRRIYAHQARDISWALADFTGLRLTQLMCTMVAAQTVYPGRTEGYSLSSLRPQVASAFERMRIAAGAKPGTPLKAWLPTYLSWGEIPAPAAVESAVATMAVETAALAKETMLSGLGEAVQARLDVEQVWRWQGFDGIQIDLAATNAAAGRIRMQAERLKRQLGFDPMDPNSAKSWAQKVGITLPTGASGQPTLARQTLTDAIVPASVTEEWELFLKARSLGSFTGKLKELSEAADSNNLVHPEIRIFTDNASTGRMPVSKPALQNLANAELEGTGLQTLRNCLVAGEGKVLVSCDLAHVEPSVLAAITQDPALMKAVGRDADVYVETAVALWGAEVRGSKEARSRAKTLLLALLYGKGDESLAKDLSVPVEEAREAKERLLGSYPVMGAWVKETRARAKAGTELFTAFGRPVAQLAPAEAYKSINYLIQGTAADLLCEMTLDIADALDQYFPTARLWLPVHDELVIECDEEHAERVRKMLEALMSTELDGVPVWGEAEILGSVWSK